MMVLALSVVLLGIAFLGFALKIIFRRNGKFPELHIGRNKDLKKRGISCATSQDRMEQFKVKKARKFKQLSLLDKELESL